MNNIIITENKYHGFKINRSKRLRELNKLKVKELCDLVEHYNIKETYEGKILKSDYINGIILYEEMLLGYKQTEIKIYVDGKHKSYFVETKNNLIMVTKLICKGDIQIYNINNNPLVQRPFSRIIGAKTYYAEKVNGKIPFGWYGFLPKDILSLSNDIEICSKVIFFLESWYFYLKAKYLLCLFDGINDIIRNICFIYIERTLGNLFNIRCKLQ